MAQPGSSGGGENGGVGHQSNGTGQRFFMGSAYNLSENQKLLGSSNFTTWRFLMKGALVSEGLWEAVRTETASDQNDRAFYKIVWNVSTQLHPLLINKTSAKDAWDTLEKVYGTLSANGRFDLFRHLFSIKLDQFEGIHQYLNDIMSTQEKLIEQKKGEREKYTCLVKWLELK